MVNTVVLLQAQLQLVARPLQVCARPPVHAVTGVEPSGREWVCFVNWDRLAVHANRTSLCGNGACT